MITLCSWPCPRNVRVCSCAVLAAARPGHGTHTAGCICTASAAPGQPTGASGLPHPRAVSNAPAESRKELRLRPGTPVQQTHPCITAQGQPGLTLLLTQQLRLGLLSVVCTEINHSTLSHRAGTAGPEPPHCQGGLRHPQEHGPEQSPVVNRAA